MEKKRYSYRYKFITSQPNEKGEYYIYRFEKIKHTRKNHCVAYKMKEYDFEYLCETIITETDYKGFKKFQEDIERRKFY